MTWKIFGINLIEEEIDNLSEQPVVDGHPASDVIEAKDMPGLTLVPEVNASAPNNQVAECFAYQPRTTAAFPSPCKSEKYYLELSQ
jgi:hypothetical protein